MQRRHAWIAVGVAGVVAAVLIGANVVGAAPLPFGPMGDRQPAVPGPGVGIQGHSTDVTPYYLTAQVENTWPLAVTVTGVRPLGVTVPGSVEVLGSLPFNSDDPSEKGPDGNSQVILGLDIDAGPGWTDPDPVTGVTVEPKGSAHYQGRSFLVRITPDPDRETAVLGFEVDYAIGPIRFTTTAWGALATTVVFCGPDHPDADHGCGPT